MHKIKSNLHPQSDSPEILSLTAKTFEILEPFSKKNLSKKESTNHGRNNSYYGHAHCRYAQINFNVYHDTYPRKTRVPPCSQIQHSIKSKVKLKDSSRIPEFNCHCWEKNKTFLKMTKVQSVYARTATTEYVHKIQKRVL